MQYVFQEQVQPDLGGPLELVFDEGGALLLVAPDGERLVLTPSEWIDPFAPPLSADNREYVNQHGRWVAFDVSTEPGFRTIVGTSALRATEVHNRAERLVGTELTYPNAVLRVEAAPTS